MLPTTIVCHNKIPTKVVFDRSYLAENSRILKTNPNKKGPTVRSNRVSRIIFLCIGNFRRKDNRYRYEVIITEASFFYAFVLIVPWYKVPSRTLENPGCIVFLGDSTAKSFVAGLLRGGIEIRTHHTHQNLCVSVFFSRVVGSV